MPSQLRLERDLRHRARWRRRLTTWGFILLLLGAVAVVFAELLT
ncbi:MAG: hypothetical protein AB7G10_09625 [Reyranellaceae bacterium]